MRLEGLKGGNIIKKLKSYMYIARYGIPKKLVSDNGPPFNSEEFAKFSKDYGFQHVTSSSRYPQANGKSENAVKLAKQLLIKCKEDGTDPYIALLEQRNTPVEGINRSPVQRLMNRRVQTKLPIVSKLLKPDVVNVKQKLVDRKQKQQKFYNKGVKELPDLCSGDLVRIRKKDGEPWQKAKVQGKDGVRSYRLI